MPSNPGSIKRTDDWPQELWSEANKRYLSVRGVKVTKFITEVRKEFTDALVRNTEEPLGKAIVGKAGGLVKFVEGVMKIAPTTSQRRHNQAFSAYYSRFDREGIHFSFITRGYVRFNVPLNEHCPSPRETCLKGILAALEHIGVTAGQDNSQPGGVSHEEFVSFFWAVVSDDWKDAQLLGDGPDRESALKEAALDINRCVTDTLGEDLQLTVAEIQRLIIRILPLWNLFVWSSPFEVDFDDA